MIKKIRIIRELKRLRKKPVNKIFLTSLKMRLEVLVDSYPNQGKIQNPAYKTIRNIFSLRVTQVSLAGFMITILLGTSVATASQGSLPGEKLYPVKIFTEEVRSVTTLKNKEKAKLRMSFATKRIDEIKEMLEKTEIESGNIDIALDQFEKNLLKVKELLAEEKSLAVDIDSGITTLHQDVDKNKEVLKKTLNEKKVKTEHKQKELEEKIKNTNKEKEVTKETLIDELVEVRINREILETKEKDVYKRLEEKEETEEIREGESKEYLQQKKINEELKSKNNDSRDKREVIKSREESRKEIREKVIQEIHDADGISEDKEGEREDGGRD